MIDATHLDQLNAQQPRQAVLSLIGKTANQASEIERKDREIAFKQGRHRQAHPRDGGVEAAEVRGPVRGLQRRTKEPVGKTIDADLAALAAEIEQAEPPPHGQGDKQKPKRRHFPRTCRAAKSTTSRSSMGTTRTHICAMSWSSCRRTGESRPRAAAALLAGTCRDYPIRAAIVKTGYRALTRHTA